VVDSTAVGFHDRASGRRFRLRLLTRTTYVDDYAYDYPYGYYPYATAIIRLNDGSCYVVPATRAHKHGWHLQIPVSVAVDGLS